MNTPRAATPSQTKVAKPDYDLCVIGGGINGAGIARDAAGRGLTVLLVEARDLASATSSASTKLIHGGLRYLEQYEFSLVRHSLQERSRLLKLAPHIIWPLRFVMPHEPHLRPTWMIRTGLFLYDHLGGRKRLEKSKALNLAYDPAGAPLDLHYKKAFTYADCWVEDSRLVVLNAQDAYERGATIMTRTACTGLTPEDGHWRVGLKNMLTGRQTTHTATKIINAAGPWVRGVLESSQLTTDATPHIRLVKGSHIITKKLYDGDHAYILQQPDRRIVFAIPYEHDFTLIGTTDVEFSGDPAAAVINEEEITYLCDAINRSFKKKISAQDIISTYSGVRPLYDSGEDTAAEVTRDYKLVADTHGGADILSVFGGKLTTYRILAEQAVSMLFKGETWTAATPLPGGDLNGHESFDEFLKAQKKVYPWLPTGLLSRYARSYGSKMDEIIGVASTLEALGEHLGGHLYEAEIRYLVKQEWAMTADDILWRRSKLGMHVSTETVQNLTRSPLLPS